MVENRSNELDGIFHALSNSTRRHIVLELAKRDLTVNELANKYDMSVQGVSKHIQVLVRSGLVTQKRAGRIKRCSFNYETLENASELIQRYRAFWEARLESLEKYFNKKKIMEDKKK
jgi:DNA-binding transcriptional ArsR family regulator